MNTSSVVETLRELDRWEKKASVLERRLIDVKEAKMKLRERLRSLELTLAAVDGLSRPGTEGNAQRFDGMR